jgi:hypothetical protein
MDSDYSDANNALALALLGQSQFEQMESVATVAGLLPPPVAASLRAALEDDAKKATAVSAISAISESAGPFRSAVLFSAIGQVDSALVALANAEAIKDVNTLVFLTTAPVFDVLRDDYRYADLVRKLGIPR